MPMESMFPAGGEQALTVRLGAPITNLALHEHQWQNGLTATLATIARTLSVMAGLVPAIHVFDKERKTWMPAT